MTTRTSVSDSIIGLVTSDMSYFMKVYFDPASE